MSIETNKVVLLGEKGVGKSCLVYRLIRGSFQNHSESTIGAAFVSHKISYKDHVVPLNIWDMAGHDRFSHFLPLYLRNVQMVLICFELPKLDKIKKYVQTVRDIDPGVPIVLVATKIDLYGIPLSLEEVELVHPDIEEYAKESSLDLYYTSSFLGQGVNELFQSVARILVSRNREAFNPSPNSESRPLQLQKSLRTRCCFG